jgi:hypothetical protein
VFDGGSVTVDTNGSIGMTTPARVSLNSLQSRISRLVIIIFAIGYRNLEYQGW